MKKLWIPVAFLLSVGASVVASAPGCAAPCADLSERCDECGDASYRASCEALVDEGNDAVCKAQLRTFALYCTGAPGAGGGGSGAGGGGACTLGTVRCAGECVSLAADQDNCGSCALACGSAEGGSATPYCYAGECVSACPAGTALNDDGGCVDLSTDPQNCGALGTTCAPEELCEAGQCVAACDPAGTTPTACNGSCVNLASDPLHCGQCGQACGAALVCSNGACASACGEGLTQCCAKCVDATSDPVHCGGCTGACASGSGGSGGGGGAGGAGGSGGSGGPNGAAEDCTATGQFCANGACQPSCDGDGGTSGLTACGQACVDTDTDAANCGGCGQACVGGMKCSGGSCVSGCPGGESDCGGGCANLDSDPSNCGKCGNVCGSGQVCNLGGCASQCGSGLVACDGGCYGPTDPQHCGTGCLDCSTVSGKPKCNGTTCVAACPTGTTDCSGACVNLTSNLFHCGECDNGCSDKSVCTGDSCESGECKNVSGAVSCNDSNACTEDLCDPQKGCTYTPFKAAQILAVCTQLNPSWDPSTACIYCDSTPADGKLCNQTPDNPDGATCSPFCPASRVRAGAPTETPDDNQCGSGEKCCPNDPLADATSGCLATTTCNP